MVICCINISGIFFTYLYVIDRYHPDKNASNPEASELFKEVAYSYSILSDPEKRRQYDSAGFEVPFQSSVLSFLFQTSYSMKTKNIACGIEEI